MSFLLVGIGGFFGAISRFGISKIKFLEIIPNLPLKTVLVNIIGCFFIGILAVLYSRSQINTDLFNLFVVGFLGSFTTFSAFGLETYNLFSNGNILHAVINIVISILMGIFAVYVGTKVFA